MRCSEATPGPTVRDWLRYWLKYGVGKCADLLDGVPSCLFAGDIGLFLHTSGTTSRPKGVPLSHANLTASLRNIVATYEFTPADRSLLVMPLFHVHGLMAGQS